MDSSGVIIIIALAVVFLAILGIGIWREKKRQEAFQALADEMGLTYAPGRNYSLPERYFFLNQLDKGDNRYVQHVFRGTYDGLPVMFFEYHYETSSTTSKGGRTVHHYYLSVFLTKVPGPAPELTIRPEGFFSKVAQALGYDDIDFESAEFSRKYCVRSKDKKFAYDICHPAAIEFLLSHPYADIEIEGNEMAIVQESGLDKLEIPANLILLTRFRRLWPDYLEGISA
ncbi:MAG: hypothetical protein J0I10_22585 [Verrucomicrobia bacterium]|nr:hypothetical protein [Verrucomicrobiota bacterium]